MALLTLGRRGGTAADRLSHHSGNSSIRRVARAATRCAGLTQRAESDLAEPASRGRQGAARVRSWADVQAVWRRMPRVGFHAAGLHADAVLQRQRHLDGAGQVAANRRQRGGNVGRSRDCCELHVAVVVQCAGTVSLAVSQSDVPVRREHVRLQRESAAEIRRLLRTRRLAGDSQPATAGDIGRARTIVWLVLRLRLGSRCGHVVAAGVGAVRVWSNIVGLSCDADVPDSVGTASLAGAARTGCVRAASCRSHTGINGADTDDHGREVSEDASQPDAHRLVAVLAARGRHSPRTGLTVQRPTTKSRHGGSTRR